MSSLHLSHIYNPAPDSIGKTLYQFLRQLGGPTVIHVRGKSSQYCRVLVTLLHGNEPSGLKAVHSLLLQGHTPAFDIKIVIASVVAAHTEPVFTHRMLPGQQDLNRCFGQTKANLQYQLATAISDCIKEWQPQAIIDLHNTSGSGPAFCVSTHNTDQHLALASHFTHRMIYTDIRLGSIMEQPFDCPIVTAEAGGSQDAEADIVALKGLTSFFNSEHLFTLQQQIDVLSRPRRLELKENSSVAYANSPVSGISLTMRQDIERLNFAKTPKNESLGWLNEDIMNTLQLDVEDMEVSEFFKVESGEFKTKRDLIMFMVTTRADIAKSDCLFYFVPT